LVVVVAFPPFGVVSSFSLFVRLFVAEM